MAKRSLSAEPPSQALNSRSARSSREPRASQPLWIAAIHRRSSSRPALDRAGHLSPLSAERALGRAVGIECDDCLVALQGQREAAMGSPRGAERYADQPPTPQFFGNSHFQNGHVPERRRKIRLDRRRPGVDSVASLSAVDVPGLVGADRRVLLVSRPDSTAGGPCPPRRPRRANRRRPTAPMARTGRTGLLGDRDGQGGGDLHARFVRRWPRGQCGVGRCRCGQQLLCPSRFG